ncbi:hypothetical protein C0991_010497, partial [Blastosporella zonata]
MPPIIGKEEERKPNGVVVEGAPDLEAKERELAAETEDEVKVEKMKPAPGPIVEAEEDVKVEHDQKEGEEDVKVELDQKQTNVPEADHTMESIPLPLPEESSSSLPSSLLTSPSSSPIFRSNTFVPAHQLYALYPPTHPSLSLPHIMGPQSVVYTWSESFSSLPTDTEAEAMVSCPGLIVYPYIEEDEVIEDTASEWEEEKPISKRKRFRGKLKGKVKSKLKRFRR